MNVLRIWKLFSPMVIFLVIFTGCAYFTDYVHMDIGKQKPLHDVGNTTLLAGAAKADITPPPGMPKGGYSTWGNYSKGFTYKTRAYSLVRKPLL